MAVANVTQPRADPRLPRFLAAAAALDDAAGADAPRRVTYLAYADVVPTAVAAGMIKLRRAQGLSGAERDAMLGEAERMFLSIRAHADGQAELHLALGEIYARLGKTAESDAELNGLLARNEPELTAKVAHVYRNLGNLERAIAIATDAFDHAASPHREQFASLLGLIVDDDDESERWFRKADQNDPFVRTSLLEIEGRRLLRQGKYDECAEKFAVAAAAYERDLAAARAAMLESDRLWPAQADPLAAAAVVVDEAGVLADAGAWAIERTQGSSFAALGRLVAEGDPLADAIRRSPSWPRVVELARADRGRPGLLLVRVARLTGDPALAARARAVFDDDLVRMRYELYARLAPGPGTEEDLALLRSGPR
ncbi:MAG TPA: hypothetical protein VM734_19885 [Kofleriaceae bacterium]|nr:hypothetical protein [Kofleriaceae bacterium]